MTWWRSANSLPGRRPRMPFFPANNSSVNSDYAQCGCVTVSATATRPEATRVPRGCHAGTAPHGCHCQSPMFFSIDCQLVSTCSTEKSQSPIPAWQRPAANEHRGLGTARSRSQKQVTSRRGEFTSWPEKVTNDNQDVVSLQQEKSKHDRIVRRPGWGPTHEDFVLFKRARLRQQ